MEYLFKVNFHSNVTGFKMYLHVWADDCIDAMNKLSAIIGPGAEYSLDAVSSVQRDDHPVSRQKGRDN